MQCPGILLDLLSKCNANRFSHSRFLHVFFPNSTIFILLTHNLHFSSLPLIYLIDPISLLSILKVLTSKNIFFNFYIILYKFLLSYATFIYTVLCASFFFSCYYLHHLLFPQPCIFLSLLTFFFHSLHHIPLTNQPCYMCKNLGTLSQPAELFFVRHFFIY